MFTASSKRSFASKSKVAKKIAATAKNKVKSAVYGCGLSASGALAIPRLVVNENYVTAKEAHKPLRIPHLNTKGIKQIAAGFGFSLFASKDKLYGSGLNNRNSGSTPSDYYISAKRIQLPGENAIVSVSSGRAHSLVATTSGVFAFGDNVHGQCGQDPEKYKEVHGLKDSPLPVVEIPSDSPAVAVHCALDSSYVLTERGEVFAFGLNEDGQCANGSYGIQWKPSRIQGEADEEKIISITGSSDTLVALSEKGEIFIWGQCEYGQAGLGVESVQLKLSRFVPFPAGKIISIGTTASSCVANTECGEVYVWGVGLLGLGPATQKLDRPTLMDQPLFGKEKVSRVYAGNTSCGALTENGRLYMWGQNRYGLLGLEHGKDQYFPFQVFFPYDVRHVSLGPDHSLFLMK